MPSKYDINHIGDRGVGNGANKYSLERERKLGHALAQDVDLSTKLVTDPMITEYVNRLGQRIVGNSDAQVPVTIKVIESDEINAFNLPGGYLYVYTGMILAADNEAELASVMAHEVAHVAARHATRGNSHQNLAVCLHSPGVWRACRSDVVHEVWPRCGAGSRPAWAGIRIRRRLRSPSFRSVFREVARQRETETKWCRKSLRYSSRDGRPHSSRAKEISSLLPDKAEYVVDTSELQEVKARVANLTRKRPVLHRRGPAEHDVTPISRTNVSKPLNPS